MVVMISCLGNDLKSIAVHELLSKKVSNIEKVNQSKEKLEGTLRSRLGGVVVLISCVGKLVTQPPLVAQVQHICSYICSIYRYICSCMAHICALDQFIKFFLNLQKSQAVLCYILMDMLETVFCSNIAPSLSR